MPHTTVNIPSDIHTKVVRLCQERQVTLKYLVLELLRWAGETDVKELIRCGVCLPIWPSDSPELYPEDAGPEAGSRD